MSSRKSSSPINMIHFKSKYLFCILALPVFSGSLFAQNNSPEAVARLWFQSYSRGEITNPVNLMDLTTNVNGPDLSSNDTTGRGSVQQNRLIGKDYQSTLKCITGYSIAYCKTDGMRSYLVVHRIHGEWKLQHPPEIQAKTKNTSDEARTEPKVTLSPEKVAGLWLIAIANRDEGTLQKISTSDSLGRVLKLSREGYKVQSEQQREELVRSAHELSRIMECKMIENRALCKPEGRNRWIHLTFDGEWKVDFRGFVEYDRSYMTQANGKDAVPAPRLQ